MEQRLQKQKGMTLVELMIALVLGLIVTGVVIDMFLSSRQMYRVQDARARLQENGRYAIEHIAKQIRNAGYSGCATRSANQSDTSLITNTLNTAYQWDFETGIQGFDASGAIWSPTKDDSITGPGPDTGTDILTIRTMVDPVIEVVGHVASAMKDGSAAIQIKAPHSLAVTDIVMVTDCYKSAVFQISSINNIAENVGLSHAAGNAPAPGNSTTNLGKNYEGADLVRLTTTSFYISGSSLQQRIFNNSEELIQGIENMQILYGIDTGVDEIVDDYVPASVVTDWGDVLSVRVSLVMVTEEENLTVDGPQDYRLNDTMVTPAAGDSRLRETFTRTVSLRNRMP